MKNELNDSKGFLKEKLGSYQVDPPASVWTAISGHLGRRSRRSMVIIVMSAAASLALAVTLGIHYFGPEFSHDSGMADIVEETDPVASVPFQQAEQDIQQTARQENLEEKVVRIIQAQAVQPQDDPEAPGKEEFPFDIGTPSISEILKTGQEQADKPYTATGQEEVVFSLNPQSDPEPAVPGIDEAETEELTLDAGETVALDSPADFGDMQKKDQRWNIGASLSPLYSFRDAAPEAMAGMQDHESGVVSYAGGVQVGYRTTRRLAIETGVFFNKMGVSIGAPGIQAFSKEFDFAPIGAESSGSDIIAITNSVGNIITKSGEIYVNNYKLNASYDANELAGSVTGIYADQGIRQHLDYLEVPLNLRYTVVDRSLKVQLVGGMSTNLLVNNYVTMETPEGTKEIGYLSNIRNVNYSGNAGIGFVYHFLDHLSLSLEPRFRYFINSVNDATLPSTRPYTFGLYTGLNYNF